jgi:RNA polymerase sigma factor (sigma-70 family)
MTAKPSQTALYGELLTNEEAYSKDVGELPRLSREEQNALVAKALLGDIQAREALILSIVPYVMAVARKYATICTHANRKRIEYLDLVQIGNLALLECLDRALAHQNPIGYLKVAAAGEIIEYCQKYSSLIASYRKRDKSYARPIDLDSLDTPVRCSNEEEADCTLADTLVAPEPVPEPPERDYSALYQAVATLTEKQRYVVEHHYGMNCPPQTLHSVSCKLRAQAGKPYKETANEAYSTHRGAIVKLAKILREMSVCA